MYFRLVWIKEKNWGQYELDLLVWWSDENFVRDFLSHWGVVAVSIEEFKGDAKSFWNIIIYTKYNDADVQILTSWEDLAERLYFFMYLWVDVTNANYVSNPITEEEVKALILSTMQKIQEENERIKKEEEETEAKEQKKYEETGIDKALDIINWNIDRVEQIIKVWDGILSWTEIKELENYLNEMKKIRLWTNLNKMASLMLDSHRLIKKAENMIFETYKSWEFLISSNSYATNIDVLRECYRYSKTYEKSFFMPSTLSTNEVVDNILWINSIYLRLLKHDFLSTFETTSFDEFLWMLMKFAEFFILTVTVVFSVAWVIATICWVSWLSLYFLPAFWWLGLLIYLFNSLNLKWVKRKICGLIVLVLLYWRWLILLLSTFAL